MIYVYITTVYILNIYHIYIYIYFNLPRKWHSMFQHNIPDSFEVQDQRHPLKGDHIPVAGQCCILASFCVQIDQGQMGNLDCQYVWWTFFGTLRLFACTHPAFTRWHVLVHSLPATHVPFPSYPPGAPRWLEDWCRFGMTTTTTTTPTPPTTTTTTTTTTTSSSSSSFLSFFIVTIIILSLIASSATFSFFSWSSLYMCMIVYVCAHAEIVQMLAAPRSGYTIPRKWAMQCFSSTSSVVVYLMFENGVGQGTGNNIVCCL